MVKAFAQRQRKRTSSSSDDMGTPTTRSSTCIRRRPYPGEVKPADQGC